MTNKLVVFLILSNESQHFNYSINFIINTDSEFTDMKYESNFLIQQFQSFVYLYNQSL